MFKMNFYLYVKLFVLLDADKTVIISESADDLHHAYNEFYTYCNQWKLTVNVEKTKLCFFQKAQLQKMNYFHDEVIESVKEYKYLGIIFFML